jgi:hypothetical protein
MLGFRARASRISSSASGRGGPRYCGGQQSGLKKTLSSPTGAGTSTSMGGSPPVLGVRLGGLKSARVYLPRPRLLCLVRCAVAPGWQATWKARVPAVHWQQCQCQHHHRPPFSFSYRQPEAAARARPNPEWCGRVLSSYPAGAARNLAVANIAAARCCSARCSSNLDCRRQCR